MRRVAGILGICVAASVVWGSLLAETPETTPETKPDTETQSEDQPGPQTAEELRQRLHEPITLKLDSVPLEDALIEILRKRDFEYWFDHEKMKEESIRLETIEVTCDLKHVSIRAALKRILGQARLGWICDDAGILITTHSHQINACFPRIYDVGELLRSPEVEVKEPGMPHQEIRFRAGGAIVKEGKNAKPNEKAPELLSLPKIEPGAAKPEEKTPEAAKTSDPTMPMQSFCSGGVVGNHFLDDGRSMLMHTIQTATGGSPDAPWMEADGEGGTVNIILTSRAKLLVVRQNELAHAEIEHLLNELISHQHAGEEEAEEAPVEKNASRSIVKPRVRIVAKQKSR